MGLSWGKILDGLEDNTKLPPAHARHLLAELEALPFTKAMLFEEERRPDRAIDGFASMMEEMTGQKTRAPTEDDCSDQEIEKGLRSYIERRKELIALLRKAIERDEPLRVSS
jgi:hypothetical protein